MQVKIPATNYNTVSQMVQKFIRFEPFVVEASGSIKSTTSGPRKSDGGVFLRILIDQNIASQLITTDAKGLFISIDNLNGAKPSTEHDLIKLESVDLIGGESLGSPIRVPCVLKGFCDGPVEDLRPLQVILLGKLSFSLPEQIRNIMQFTISLPAIPMSFGIAHISDSMGVVTINPLTVSSEAGTVEVQLDVLVNDVNGFQQTAFRLFNEDLLVTCQGIRYSGVLLHRLLADVPISISVPAPRNRIKTFFTLPTVCDGRWAMEKTTKETFTAGIKLPDVVLPVPLRLGNFKAVASYNNTPVFAFDVGDRKDFVLSIHEGQSTQKMYVTTLTADRTTCPYKTRNPRLCHVGEAAGIMFSLGDAGQLQMETEITFYNPVTRGIQRIYMPVRVFPKVYQRPDPVVPPSSLECLHVNEMISDVSIKFGDTIAKNLKFWEGIDVDMQIKMTNFFAFDINVEFMDMNMYIQDMDGVPDDPKDKNSALGYKPDLDYFIMSGIIDMGGFVIPAGDSRWSPTISPALDASRPVETAARMYDEAVNNRRMCSDMRNSIIGVKLAAPGQVRC